MNKITSFCVNHDILKEGLYVSRVDGDVVTYDLRMCEPNKGNYLSNAGLHTFEHLFATYVRNTPYSDSIIYAGPMGCRTGFYFLCRDTLTHTMCIKLLQDTMQFIANFEGVIPGAQLPKECGNYLDHNLEEAKLYAKNYAEVIKDYSIEKLQYPQ